MIQLLTGDCREILPTLPAGSVQCCVTSPPYWGLRDYGTNGQLGLEATPEEYISKMVAIFREVWRVLRDDGTLWVNMGDSYASSGERSNTNGLNGSGLKRNVLNEESRVRCCEENKIARGSVGRRELGGLKPKDLCGIPWRLAFALQADGWYLRSDIIWAKPNPMPESVTDRPTKAHEYIFLLTKSERYFYDADAIREPLSEVSLEQIEYFKKHGARADYLSKPLDDSRRDKDSFLAKCGRGVRGEAMINANGRNKRSVWTIATQPYSEAHFATFPEEIPKLCILAGSKPGDTILDPFAGSGTVGKVALELGRKAVLIELSPTYVELARERTNVTPSLFCNGVSHQEPELNGELTFSFMEART